MHLFKLISKRVLSCSYCSQDVEAGEAYIRLKGAAEETEGLSGPLHFSCFVHWISRVPAKQ